MPFNTNGVIIDRATVFCVATGEDIAIHRYKSEEDTLSEIATDGYFPDYLGGTEINVIIGDLMLCSGTDATDTFTVTSASPLTIIPQADPTGNVSGPVSATLNAVAKYGDTTGKVLVNSGVTIDSSNNLSTATINVTGQGAVFGNTTTGADWAFHERGARSVTHWIEADTSNDPGEGYNPGSLYTQDGNASAFRVGYSNDNQVRIDIASGVGSPSNDFVISTAGTLVNGGVIGTMPTVTPGTARVTIPANSITNIAVVPGITLTNVTLTPVAANPGTTTTLWVKSSNSHLMLGATDTGIIAS